jgi:hypothetical protein
MSFPTITPEATQSIIETINVGQFVGIVTGSVAGLVVLLITGVGFFLKRQVTNAVTFVDHRIEEFKVAAFDGYIERKIELEENEHPSAAEFSNSESKT